MEPAVPEDQLDLPRHKRQFPYRAADPEEQRSINIEAETIIESLEGMLVELIRKRLPAGAESEFDDIAQEVRFHLWTHSLPRYDAWRKPRAKLTTFLRYCANDAVTDQLRKLARRRQPERVSRLIAAPDNFADRQIEKIADDIIANPDRFFRDTKARVLRGLIDGQPREKIAKKLRTSAKHVSDVTYRLRTEILEIAKAKCA